MGRDNIIMYASPVFFALIAVEIWWSRKIKRKVYRVNDSFGDLACGVVETLGDTLMMGGLMGVYQFLYGNFALISISESNPINWLWALIGLDFCYYWFHRASHRVNLFWMAHVVHHQSEEYNLTVALRQSMIQVLFSFLFYSPLAVVGFTPKMIIAVYFFDMFYQFWIHSRLIPKLGAVESIMNTPSHHRVHHGRNPRYMDKNYAGVFIIWDRLFGTYIEEGEEPIYGITTPLNSFNPITANLQYVKEMFKKMRTLPTLWDKVQVWVRPPNWRPAVQGGPMKFEEVDPRYKSYDPPASQRVLWFAGTQLALVLVTATIWLYIRHGLTTLMEAAILGFIVFTLVSVSGILDNKKWIRLTEPLRAGYVVVGLIAVLLMT